MDQVSQIRDKIDLVEFISGYLPLKKMGRNFKAPCPFHNEKTPSFIVSPERQIWHCFGCGKGGDVFTFLMEYENMEFPEALRELAKKAGITLKDNYSDKGGYSEKEKIYAINAQAIKFYEFILTKHPVGKNALDYLLNIRKIAKGLIQTFQLGFSPNTGSALTDYLIKKKNYNKKDLLVAGISFERDGRLFDFFRGRVMFPLFDHRGNAVGFSGRSLVSSDSSKYINTKETPVYHKGNMFFGLNVAKEEIKKVQNAIIVEGEFDVISLFENDIKNVIAIKGTALTENQASLLARFTPKVTLCLDQDDAGFEATKRSLEHLEKKGLTTSIVILKDAKDPDELAKKSPGILKKALKESIGVYDFLIEKLLLENDKKEAEGKKKISDTLLPLISNISNEIVKEHFLKKLSLEIDISLERLEKEMDKNTKKEAEDKIIIPSKVKKTRREVLEEYIIALILQTDKPKEMLEKAKTNLKGYEFEVDSLGKIFDKIKAVILASGKLDIKSFSSNLPKELVSAFDNCYLLPILGFKNENQIDLDIVKVSLELMDFYHREKIAKTISSKNI